MLFYILAPVATIADNCKPVRILLHISQHTDAFQYKHIFRRRFSFLFSVDSHFFMDYLHQEVLIKSKVFVMRSWQFVMLKPAEALTSHVTLTDRSHEQDTGIRANSSKICCGAVSLVLMALCGRHLVDEG